MCLRFAGALACVLMPPLPAFAQKAPEPKFDCAKATSTAETAWCAELDLKKTDAALSEAYKAALAAAEKAAHLQVAQRRDWRRALQEAQRKWLAFREADCGAPVSWEWFQGTGTGAASLACKIAKSEQRTAELKARYAGR